jgi:hypothetical protein
MGSDYLLPGCREFCFFWKDPLLRSSGRAFIRCPELPESFRDYLFGRAQTWGCRFSWRNKYSLYRRWRIWRTSVWRKSTSVNAGISARPDNYDRLIFQDSAARDAAWQCNPQTLYRVINMSFKTGISIYEV